MDERKKGTVMRMAGNIAGGLCANPEIRVAVGADANQMRLMIAETAVTIALRIMEDQRLNLGGA